MSYHRFAIYVESLSEKLKGISINNIFSFKDSNIKHRLTNVLRLEENEELIIFDEKINIICQLLKESFNKSDHVSLLLIKKESNIPLEPKITLYLGITRKEAFEQCMYYACQMGIEKVYPLITKKIQRKFSKDNEEARIKRIFIAASEQSKNFIFPKLENSLSIDQISTNLSSNTYKVYCHINGNNFFSALNEIHTKKIDNISIIIGPEGDFTHEECNKLDQLGFKPILLTPTVLRSEDAVCIALGGIRSVAIK